MRRRRLLAIIGAGTLSLAGCTTGTDGTGGIDSPSTGTPTEPTDGGTNTGTDSVETETAGTDTAGTDRGTGEPTDLPADCPATQSLDVEWPADLDASAVESFVEAYEHVYYRDVVVEYEPRSQVDSYELDGGVNSGPRERGDGWELDYSGSGGVYRPTLLMGATVADPPEGADVVPVSEIDDAPLAETLQEAAESGEAEHFVDTPGAEVDRYVDLLASLSDDFERLSGPGDGDSLYVDVDGTTVELTVTASNFHGDYWWDARYYVDEHVVRRTSDEDVDPRDGELLECRQPD